MALFEDRKQLVLARVAELTTRANTKFNITLPNIQVYFNLKGRCAGMAMQRVGAYILRFNQTMMMNEGWDHLYNDTVPHELAHTVCQRFPKFGRNHDMGWKFIAQQLGSTGERCHTEKVVFAKGNTYAYVTTAGKEHNVSERRHKNIQCHGAVYTVKHNGGKLTSQCSYQLVAVGGREVAKKAVAARPAVPNPTVRQPHVVTPAGASKADQIRARITLAKQRGEAKHDVVLYGVQALGMTLSLAKTYVSNNWNRV